MRIGLTIPSFTWPGGAAVIGKTLGEIGRRAEDAGFYSIWVMDHFFQIEMIGPAENDMLEGYATLGFLAAHTRKVKLGTLVTGVTYRPPGVLVKAVTTLDVLSGGRAYFGVGAAWNEREHLGLGVPFPPVSERFERLEETLQIAKQMWSGKVGRFDGKHYQLAETLCVPAPLSKPHPPILIGGVGEKKTLRLVARYADACNLFLGLGEDVVRSKLEVLKEHCANEGRPYDSIEKTGLGILNVSRNGGNGAMSLQQAIEWFGSAGEMGFDHMVVGLPNVHDPAVFELLGSEIIPAVTKVAVAGRA